MKKVLMFILICLSQLLLISCDKEKITIEVEKEEIIINLLEEVDYKNYFKLYVNDKEIEIKDEYITSNVDNSVAGTYKVILTYEESFKSINVIVKEENKENKYIKVLNEISSLEVGSTYTLNIDTNEDEVSYTSSDVSVIKVENGVLEAFKEGTAIIQIKGSEASIELNINVYKNKDYEEAFKKLIDKDKWNFVLTETAVIKEYDISMTDVYEYDGNNIYYKYEYDDVICEDYLIKDNGKYYYYTNIDGKYAKYNEDDEDYEFYTFYLPEMDFSNLLTYDVYKVNENGKDIYYFKNIEKVGEEILYFDETVTVDKITFEIENDKVTKFTFVTKIYDDLTEETYTYDYILELSNYGNVNIDVEEVKELVKEVEITKTKSYFLDASLSVKDGEPTYKTNRVSDGYDNTRGVQFLQKNGNVTITSVNSFVDVKSVTLVVSTNQELGAKIKVKVGSKYLTYLNEEEITIKKTNFNETNTITFTSNELLDGNIVVELIPTSDKKSIYIQSIEYSKDGIVTSEYMENQTYDASTFNNNRLQDYIKIDDSIGLSSTGTYDVLVCPVQFSQGQKYTSEMLNNLEKAFNGTSVDTGWESVSSYYYKSSFGKLNMQFDISTPIDLSHNAKYYERYSKNLLWEDGEVTEKTGDMLILEEVLSNLEKTIDLTKYDYDSDGVIDGVYLIYNYDVDYSDDSFYWAFTSWYQTPDETLYDNLSAYYYLFASYYFLMEDSVDGYEYGGTIDGLLLNSATFIHETGHMLSLDDYYDYYPYEGSNMGLGGADMMDATCGDHNSYSKIMLNWVTPEIVTDSKTITIGSFASTGECLLIPLDFDNSYMCEYLLIDLYTNTDLNKLHGDINLMYGLCQWGVRIYHVSSNVDNPYSDEYGSFTTNNNSISENALIYLVEADGETDFASGEGYATSSDLWLKGDSLKNVFPNFKRNDGKLINFDIVIENVTADSAQINIIYN